MSPFYPVHAGERHQRLARGDNSALRHLHLDPRPPAAAPRSRGPLEAISGSAPAAGPAPPAPVSPQTVTVSSVGTQNWQRQVRILLAPEGPATRLIVGGTVNPPGHRAGVPAHKHDEATADEGVLEEIYNYRLSPPGGYLIQ